LIDITNRTVLLNDIHVHVCLAVTANCA